ncbi:MAG: leucine--tRNA ligase [Fimbriimonadaceae bacterium]
MRDRYEPGEFEAGWRAKWAGAGLFKTREEEGREKFYAADFFPYPSGAGLSVGHCRNYVPTDVLCRMKVMQGFNVLHPMGFDAFGLPAEVEAIKRKTHPAPMIDQYAANYRRQMDLIGVSYDWSRSFKSSDPEFYRWTQWVFSLLYKKGLAYRKDASVNWCPFDKTVLADEEVVGGLCWRCNNPVEKKNVPQWFFKITAYADRLVDDLDGLDWPEGIKAQQRNWIGRSEGVEFEMVIAAQNAGSTAAEHGGPVAQQPDDHRSATGQPLDDELAALKAEVAAEGGAGDWDKQYKIDDITKKLDKAQEGLAKGTAKFERAVMNIKPDDSESFQILEREKRASFRVFTTRIDTIFGMTFCVLAPEHALVAKIFDVVDAQRSVELRDYIDRAKRMSEADRTAATREKTGVFTGVYAINPANGKRVPVWIADYVMMGYGTGAIMAVPAHDERDHEFATKYGLDVVPVIAPSGGPVATDSNPTATGKPQGSLPDLPFSTKDGVMINSGEYDGLTVQEGQQKLTEWITALGIGEKKRNCKLRDWLISRQRYWGCPIPVIHQADGTMDVVRDQDLPVELPDVDRYEPGEDGSSPLAHIPDFVNVTDHDGRLGRRETDTMGGFACSSWYFLRFCDPHNDEKAWDPERVKYWMPVDCYVGGAEHAVMHLLYARFWTKFLFDEGLVTVQEPFARLKNQGQVLGRTPYRRPKENENLQVGEEGVLVSYEEAKTLPEKDVTWRWVRMSKSKGNVVTPDEAVEQFGADALRLWELFVAPFDADVEWTNDGMNGTARFLSRLFKLAHDLAGVYDRDWHAKIAQAPTDGVGRELRRSTHKFVAKATKDIDGFAFNTYVAAAMEHLNTVNDLLKKATMTDAEKLALSEMIELTVLCLSPAAPHTTDEIWEGLGHKGFTYDQKWPTADPDLAKDDTVTIAVQVNGKLRDTIEMPADATGEQLEAAARQSEKAKPHYEAMTVRKVVVVAGKLVNIVAN